MTTLAVVELETTSGLAEDRIVNTWTIGTMSATAPAPTITGTASALTTFYNDIQAGISSRIVRAGTPHIIKFYDITGLLNGAPHGSPYAMTAWGIGSGPSGSDLPDEVAIALRLEAVARSSQPAEAPDGTDANSPG
jgi:hypothetical protein